MAPSSSTFRKASRNGLPLWTPSLQNYWFPNNSQLSLTGSLSLCICTRNAGENNVRIAQPHKHTCTRDEMPEMTEKEKARNHRPTNLWACPNTAVSSAKLVTSIKVSFMPWKRHRDIKISGDNLRGQWMLMLSTRLRRAVGFCHQKGKVGPYQEYVGC